MNDLSRRELLATLITGAAGAVVGVPASSHAATTDLPILPRELWAWVKAQQVLTPGIAWLDAAGYAPALRAALVNEYRDREALNLDLPAYVRTNLSPDGVRALLDRIGGFAGASADELLLTTGATESLNIVANGLQLETGDEVVTTTLEHSASLHPWLLQARRRGIVVTQVPLPGRAVDPEQIRDVLAAAIGPRTRVLAISHVQYADGTLMPVRELCELARDRGVWSVVDGAQAFGMLDYAIEALGCDFYAASLSKWFAAGLGAGLLYVRRERLADLWPLAVDGPVGWNEAASFGLADPVDADLRAAWPATAAKLATSFRYFGPLHRAVETALDLQERIGRARIEARIRELAMYVRLGLEALPGVRILTPVHPALWGGIVALQTPRTLTADQGAQLARALFDEERIVVRHVAHSAVGFNALRLAPHVYNSHEELDRAIAAIRQRLV